jgi:hypothetical protein
VPRSLTIVLAVLVVSSHLCGQTLPSPTAQPTPSTQPTAEARLRAELDSLLTLGVSRPYGLGFAQAPESERKPGPATVVYEPAGTSAAGLLLHLCGELLDDDRYRAAAMNIARGLSLAMDTTGRVPASAVFLPGQVGQRDVHGAVPRREPTTAALGFLLVLDKHLAGKDARVASTAVRASSFLIKQQLRTGGFVTALDVPGQRYPRRIVRFDEPSTRDAVVAMLLIELTGEGRETSLAIPLAKVGSRRAVEHLLRQRFTEIDKPSRFLWPTAVDPDGTPIPSGTPGLESFPPAGNALATRYAIDTLLAFHLVTADSAAFDAARLAADALAARRENDGVWSLIDNPKSRFPPPGPEGSVWPRGDFGITPALRALGDVRLLGRQPYSTVVARTATLETLLALQLTGLVDSLPTGDLPLTRAQLPAYLAQHPELTSLTQGPEPADLAARTRRLHALYLLAKWERSLK